MTLLDHFTHLFRGRSPRSASQGAVATASLPSARPLPYSRLSLDDWRSSPDRVAYVQQLLADPTFRDLLAMLSNIRPPKCEVLDATTTAVLLGQRTGHDQVIASLLAAGTSPPAPPVDVTADYDAENAMKGWEKEGNL